MPKTRKQKHTGRHTRNRREKRRRGTRRGGGILEWLRRKKGEPENVPPLNETSDDTVQRNRFLGSQIEIYYPLFFDCKKSGIFKRYDRMGPCNKVKNITPYSDYIMSDSLKKKLLNEIKNKISHMINHADSSNKKNTRKMMDRFYRIFKKDEDYIQTAIKNFYVITYRNKQTFVNIENNGNVIPKDTKERVVAPAELYFTEEDIEKLKGYVEKIESTRLPHLYNSNNKYSSDQVVYENNPMIAMAQPKQQQSPAKEST
jgi:hypothetical protein